MQTQASAQRPDPQEDRDGDNTRPVLVIGLWITVVGFAAVLFQTWSFAWTGLLWALSLYALGVFGGFLFSLSRVVENAAAATSGTTSPVRYLPNTGLEQIADWLTKIIVGLTLVELQKIPPAILSFSTVIAASIGNSEGAKGLAYAMVVFFPIIGFLGMYLSTRLYLNQGIRRAEERAQRFSNAYGAALDNPQTSLKNPNRGVTDAVESTASDIENVQLQDLTNPSDVAAWARAKAVLEKWSDATAGYAKAVVLNPADPKLRLDYAVALFNDDAPPEQVSEQLDVGLKLVDPEKDPELASRLRGNLVMAYLYLPAPDGFTKAIDAVEQLLASQLPKRAEIYFNAACAYGQKYAYLKKSGKADQGDLQQARDKALEYTRKALDFDPSFVAAFRMVSDPNYPNKSPQDSDLEALADDPDFKALIQPNI